MGDIVTRVAKRLKLTQEQTRKLRTCASIAEATTAGEVAAVLGGIRKGEASVAAANAALVAPVEYPSRVDECPVCYAHMQPVTLVSGRDAHFCPIHNVVMPAIE